MGRGWGAPQPKSKVHKQDFLEGGGGPSTTGLQKGAAFCSKYWLRQTDKYFLEDWMQVATSKTKIPRGQYIINNLKMWSLVIVSKGARESCFPKHKTRVPILISRSLIKNMAFPQRLGSCLYSGLVNACGFGVIFLWFYICVTKPVPLVSGKHLDIPPHVPQQR